MYRAGANNGKLVPATSSGGHSGGVIIVSGAILVILSVLAFMLQIETNEAFMNASTVNGFRPDWTVFMQIPNLIAGKLDPSEAGADFFGWGVEAIYFAFLTGYAIYAHSAQSAGRALAGIFMTLSWLVVAFNVITDYNYGTFGSQWYGHLAFTIVVSLFVGKGLTAGIEMIREGYKRL